MALSFRGRTAGFSRKIPKHLVKLIFREPYLFITKFRPRRLVAGRQAFNLATRVRFPSGLLS